MFLEEVINNPDYNEIIPTKYRTERRYFINRKGEAYVYVPGHELKQLAGGVGSSGYKHIFINQTNFNIHRLVANAFVPLPEWAINADMGRNELCVNHKDGNKLNNDASNLEWTTIRENTLHAYDHELIQYRLDDKMLRKIFVMLSEGYTDSEIHNATKVPASTINNIRIRRTDRYDTSEFTWRATSVDHEARERRNDQIVNMFNAGKRIYEIAKELNVAPTTVDNIVQKAERDGFLTRPYKRRSDMRTEMPEEDVRKICEMLQKGLDNKAIAKEMNMNPCSIADIRARRTFYHIGREYTWPSKSMTPAERNHQNYLRSQVTKLYKEGMIKNQIAKKFKIRIEKVTRILKNAGLI